jgi:hypothetical protein
MQADEMSDLDTEGVKYHWFLEKFQMSYFRSKYIIPYGCP